MRGAAAWLGLGLAVSGPACVLHGPGDLRRELSAQTGVRLEREFGLTLGRMSMALVRAFVPEEAEEEIPVRGVHGVEVGVYRVVEREPDAPALDPDGFAGRNWTPIVRVHDHGEDVLVFLRQEEQHVRGMVVVVHQDDEVVLVRLRGRLDSIIEDAMRYAFEQGDHEELYDVARDDYQRRTAAGG